MVGQWKCFALALIDLFWYQIKIENCIVSDSNKDNVLRENKDCINLVITNCETEPDLHPPVASKTLLVHQEGCNSNSNQLNDGIIVRHWCSDNPSYHNNTASDNSLLQLTAVVREDVHELKLLLLIFYNIVYCQSSLFIIPVWHKAKLQFNTIIFFQLRIKK